jgi:hypothetical protein
VLEDEAKMTLDYNEEESERKKDKSSEPEKNIQRSGNDLARYDINALTNPPRSLREPTLAERFQNYYISPNPLTLRQMFREAWAAGLFKMHNKRTSPITPTFFAAALDQAGESGWEGFIDEVLKFEITPLNWWEKTILRRPTPQDRLNALTIIAFLSNSPDKRPLRYLLSRTLPPGADIAKAVTDTGQALTFYRLADVIYNPLQIDQIWAIFYATGNPSALERIIALAAGRGIAPQQEVRSKTRYSVEIIMQGAAYSLMRMAEKQEKVAYLIYKALPEYENQPVYIFLLVALQAARVIEGFEPNPDGSYEVMWRVPPDWL